MNLVERLVSISVNMTYFIGRERPGDRRERDRRERERERERDREREKNGDDTSTVDRRPHADRNLEEKAIKVYIDCK